MLDTVCRWSKLPLPLGEGWSDGIAMAPTHLSLLIRADQRRKESFLFRLLTRPSPRPSPKGRGDYLQILDTH